MLCMLCCAADCTFAYLGGDGFTVQNACADCSSAVIAANTSASLVNCTFFSPVASNGSAYIRAFDGGRVRISGCRFAPTDLRLSPFAALSNSSVYSDISSFVVRDDTGATSPPQPLAAAPALPETSPYAFLTRDDEWYVAIQQVCLAAPQGRRSMHAHPRSPRIGHIRVGLHGAAALQQPACTGALEHALEHALEGCKWTGPARSGDAIPSSRQSRRRTGGLLGYLPTFSPQSTVAIRDHA